MNEGQCSFLLYVELLLYPSDLIKNTRMAIVPYKMGVWEIR